MNLLKQFNKFESSFPATGPVRVGRGKAHAAALSLGLPTRKSEDWKYTSLKALDEVSWIPAQLNRRPLSLEHSQQIASMLPAGFTNLVFVNGEFIPQHSSPLPGDFTWTESESFDLTPTSSSSSAASFFETLQGVYFQKRFVLNIPPETSLSRPIHILSVNYQQEPVDSAAVSGTMIQVHLTVTVGARAKASIVESYLTLPNSDRTSSEEAGSLTLSNVLTRIALGSSANLSYLRIQRECDSAFHLGQTEFTQEQNSNLESLSLSLGGQLSRHQLQVKLVGPEATSKIYGAYVGRKNQHHDSQTAIQHLVGDCSTKQLYKGLLDGKSRGVFNGKICIARGAQKASSEQLNSNLLLSHLAEVDSKPQLEINADDVKATHGSTVGPLDQEELFYLLSRGIPKSKAIALLSFGFVAETVEEISNPEIKNLAISHLNEVFQKLESINL
ncbi:MAG: Fe-S cluster assembly protein SufD [Bdellovibrionaceae bacterium]|nr:Fe-S cluster assembly protein SufD [Pseudobdellovibrionaceae bacterium]